MFVGVHATISPSIRIGLIESDETKSIGKGVPAQTDRKRDAINSKAEKNIILPITDLKVSLMIHPIPIIN